MGEDIPRSDAPQPMLADGEREAMMPQDRPRTTERYLAGLAAMFRSGACEADDAGWVAASLEHAAAEVADLRARATRAEAERDQARAEVARLRAALEPFARHAADWDNPAPGDGFADDEHIDCEHDLRVGHLRAARAGLSSTSEPEDRA